MEQLRKANVRVTYDYERDGNGYPIKNAKLKYPTWLVELMGVDFFATPIVIAGHRPSPNMDDALKALRSLPNIKRVYLGATHISDVGLGYIAELQSLERLSVEYTHITNKGVIRLRDRKSLRELSLKGVNLDDRGLNELSQLIHLEAINLNGTKVTRDGVNKLAKALPHCKIDWDPNYR